MLPRNTLIPPERTIMRPRCFISVFLLLVALVFNYGCGKNKTNMSGTKPSQRQTEKSKDSGSTELSLEQDGLRALSVAMSGVHWDAKSARSADFDFDGSLDAASLGHAEGKVFVGVYRASAKQPQILEFGVNPSVQDAICEEPAQLEIESLGDDPNENIGEIDGFNTSQQSKGLELSGGDCDPIHIYWNHRTKHIWWWRNRPMA
jgi:hypothetical protein